MEAHHLEHVAAVGGASHHDLDRHVLETDDPTDPLAAEHPGLAVLTEQRAADSPRLPALALAVGIALRGIGADDQV